MSSIVMRLIPIFKLMASGVVSSAGRHSGTGLARLTLRRISGSPQSCAHHIERVHIGARVEQELGDG